MKLYIGFLAAALTATPAAAIDPRDILVNMSHEAIQCASFFLLTSVGFHNAERPSQAERFDLLGAEALGYAQELAARAGQLPETVHATFRMMIARHREEIADNLSNIAILSERYLPLCPEVMENPGLRWTYWLQELSGSHDEE